MSDDVGIEFDDIEKETDAALMIVIGDEKIWLPKSQVRLYEKKKKVYLPEWLAQSKGLI